MKEYPILLGKDDSGNWVTFPGSENAALCARSRAGKTTSFVIPNCLFYEGSLVVLDIKGQIFQATAGYRKEVLGQEVYLLDPAAPDGRTHCWNPLAAVQRDAWDLYDQVSRIAFLLFPESQATGGGTNTDKFWEPAARVAFTAVTTLVAETAGQQFTMDTVLRLFARGDGTDVIARWINARRRHGGRQYSQAAVDGVSDFLGGNLDQVEGIRKMVSTRLQPFFNPRIAAASRTSDFDLRDLRRKPMSIYIAVSPSNIGRLRPYLALFFEQLVNLNVDKTPDEDASLQYQALIMLDEFSRLGRMETLAEAAQYCAGYGMRFVYVIQNKKQIEARYGQASAVDVFDNTGAEIFFGTNDLGMTEEISKRYGDTTAMAVTQQRPRMMPELQFAKQTEAEHVHRRPVFLPQEIARMSSTQQIVFRVGMQPMLLNRQGWFDDPELRDRYRDPPEIPQIEWEVPRDDGNTRILRQRARNISGITAADVEEENGS